MVTPDYTARQQDRAPGVLRQLHETIADKPRVFRNQPALDYGELVRLPCFLSTQCDDGYLLGIPYGRHLKLFYEFDDLPPLQVHFKTLVNDLGELALKHTDCRLIALEFDDFPNRHHVDHQFVGARFRDPLGFMLLRSRDMREVELPAAPDCLSVREATEKDGAAIADFEARVSGEEALAPPLPGTFFSDARSILIAERDGQTCGYIRLLDAPRRGLMAEEFLVDGGGGSAAARALLRATFVQGAAADLRPATIRVAADVVGEPVFKTFGFKHEGDGLQYLRPADPAEAEKLFTDKITTRVRVGKIFGRF